MTMRRTTANRLFSTGFFFLFLFFTLLALLQPAAAVPVSATGLTPGAASQRNLSTMNATNVSAQGGYVTPLDINGMSITQSWQGYYGNISGNIILADANNKSLYEWGNGTSINGEIYASRSDTIDWSSIDCATPVHVAAEELYLDQASSDGDSVTNTFNGTAHTAFLVGGRTMDYCPSTYTFVDGAVQTTDFEMILLADVNDEIVYATIIDNDSTGYNGATHDFQMLVAENEKPGNAGGTPYFFFTELGA